MISINNNELGAMRNLNNGAFEMGFQVLPKFENAEEPVIFGGYDGWFIAADTKVPDEAALFLKFLNSPEVGAIWANGQGSAMCAKGVTYEDPDLQFMAENMGIAGKYKVSADYNAGSLNDDRKLLVPSLLLDESMTPAKAEEKTLDLIRRAMEDAGIN